MALTIYSYEDIEQLFDNEISLSDELKNNLDESVIQVNKAMVARYCSLLSQELLKVIRDIYPTTTMSDSATMKFARLIGYDFSFAKASIGKVKIKTVSGAATPIEIPEDWYAETKNGYRVLINTDYFMNPPETEIEVDVFQGVREEVIVTADGSALFTIDIFDSKVAQDRFQVFVNGTEWEQAENNILYYSTDTDEVYTIQPLLNGIRIVFGDGKFGKKPLAGDTITVGYIATDGIAGEVKLLGNNVIIKKVDIFDGESNNIDYSIEVTESISGAEDRETVQNVKYNIPRFLSTNPGVITANNYVSFLRMYSTIVDAAVWPGYIDGINEDTLNLVYLCPVPVDGGVLDSTEKNIIKNDLYKKHPVPNRITFSDPEYVSVIVDVKAKSNGNISSAILQSNIEDKTEELMDFEYRVDILKESIFGTLYHYRFIKNIADLSGLEVSDGVSGDLHIDFKVKDDLFTTVAGVLFYLIETQMKGIINTTFELYDDAWNLIGSADSTGDITGDTIASGNIDFNTGLGEITFISEPSGLVIATYQVAEGEENLVPQKSTQVLEFFRSDVVIET